MYKELQQQIQPRMLVILLVSLILLSITASLLYVLKKPYKELQQHQQTLLLLKNEMRTGVPLQNQIDTKQQHVDQLNLKLRGTGPQLPVNKMVPHVIGALDKLAEKHQLNLSSVKPGTPDFLFTFKELPFIVEISGDYFSLFAWLKDVENNLGPIVIKQFNIRPTNTGKVRTMTLTIVAYQFEEK